MLHRSLHLALVLFLDDGNQPIGHLLEYCVAALQGRASCKELLEEAVNAIL